ncbi:MAG: histidine kinase dimerization/phospho-acceptor domain-containing protein [Merdibacter sp.]
MIHNISHDLKTPIATIKSYGESIKDGIYPYETLEKSVDVIIENADRLEAKVHSLLYMNRVEYLISQDNNGAVTNMKDVVEKVLLNIAVIKPRHPHRDRAGGDHLRGPGRKLARGGGKHPGKRAALCAVCHHHPPE